jgi:hypothetical protein
MCAKDPNERVGHEHGRWHERKTYLEKGFSLD